MLTLANSVGDSMKPRAPLSLATRAERARDGASVGPMLRPHALVFVLAASACGATASVHDTPDPLVGAWHAYLTVDSGVLTTLTRLEFLYAFNQGGTMTESS